MVRVITAVLVCMGLAGIAQADLTIDAGTHVLQPNLIGQTIEIYVTGEGALYEVLNVNFHAQVADGGPAHGGVILGPEFTCLDLFDDDPLTDFVFDGNNTGRASGTPDGIISPQLAYEGTTTASDTATAEGLLAIITIDTTGFDSGSWDFLLTGCLSGNTDFGDVPVTVSNGTIIVPEPVSLSMILLGAGLILPRRRWSKRINKR